MEMSGKETEASDLCRNVSVQRRSTMSPDQHVNHIEQVDWLTR